RAAAEARHSGQLAQRLVLFVSTSKHKPGFVAWSENYTFSMPTYDNGVIIQAALENFRRIYRPVYAYHRAGVTLYDFLPAHQLQTDLFHVVSPEAHDRSRARMAAIDEINERFGRHRIKYAIEELSKTWEPKQRLRSPRYVSHWDELPEAYSA